MAHIQKLVIKGFKSFARETVINFDRHMNVVVGPNGSGKSNITDALCFVLGRLSIKSMRAARASHLIFSGNKQYRGANEAFAEIVLDNSDKTFALDEKEIFIRRIVKRNGQSVYKINRQTKTRQEVLELLSQAGIDPNGFNIVLQGEIEKFVKMPSEERRKIIEEVAGISVYEMRKAKSLNELDKTEEKLKQINAILRERTNYLKNLELERKQAVQYKKIEESIKKYKASIMQRKIEEKEKELNEILKKAELKKKEIEKKEEQINKIQSEVNALNEQINNIANTIQKSSGIEQDTLLAEISNLKQGIAGMLARKENYENQLNELDRRRQALEQTIKESEKEIEETIKEKGKNKKKELEDKKSKLEQLDELKRQFYLLKSNLSSINTQTEDKKRQIQMLKNELNFIFGQIEQTEKEMQIKESLEEHKNKLIKIKQIIEKNNQKITDLEKERLEKEKFSAVQQQQIQDAEKIKSQVYKLDICPLCKTKITKEHIKEVIDKSDSEISKSEKNIKETEEQIERIKNELRKIKEEISQYNAEASKREIDLVKLKVIEDKKQQLRRNSEQMKSYDSELKILEAKKKSIEDKFSKIKLSEGQYESLRLEVNELQRSEERDLGREISIKQIELDRNKLSIKQNKRDKEEILEELKEIKETLESKQEIAEEKEEQAEILKRKYQKMFEQKNIFQDKIRMFESNLMRQQNEKRNFEKEINELMIEKAQINTKKDTFAQEAEEFRGVELISMPIERLKEKLNNLEIIFSKIGNVNMRALEIYGGVKEEYDKIKEKVDQLGKEKEEILKIISQIDKKKKKSFLDTLNRINELFSRNFSQLSAKGIVFLDPQNKNEIFDGGLDIIVKVGGGKYFDVTSLSGGEQTLVALSLIFAIQEFRPYCFYIFDEIDAALDRRNSEKLAYLLKKYMKDGQYLIITHNDSIISESSNVLYGVSMQEGISKVLSLEI